MSQTLTYTLTDEAPRLATYSLLPIVKAFLKHADIEIQTADISLSARILAACGLAEDDLAALGEAVKTPDACIIKLPNISASAPQITRAICELQDKGYDIPDQSADYDQVKGSAVNPVLREGNSDRRAPLAVKNYAKAHPHSMGAWHQDSQTHVATMTDGGFFGNEVSTTSPANTQVAIEFIAQDGTKRTLKTLALQQGEILDATLMQKGALDAFLRQQIADAKAQGVLFSVHLKATMMKISDPIIFGQVIENFYPDTLAKHQDALTRIGFTPSLGMGALFNKLDALPSKTQEAIKTDLYSEANARPDLAMVDSDKGITNLHVPSDVIIDASIPAMIRAGGKMYNKAGQLQDAKIVIPDSTYAGIYDAVVEFCKVHGAFDPKTMGSTSNVGLMAQKAEEYGSHDKTFVLKEAGTVQVVDETGAVLMSHLVEAGDIWRACQTKAAPIEDWVKLALNRAKISQTPAIFWLDATRAHDAQVIAQVKTHLEALDTDAVDIEILPPKEAMQKTLERASAGLNTISVTGNVLRDYLTDLFPILELGTSAKMLSIVPLMQGGGLYETGAGGSAPKHVSQLIEENHLRWDSLGEFLALGAALEALGRAGNAKAAILADALDTATQDLLMQGQSPKRKAGDLDNRTSHVYLAWQWARQIANQTQDETLAKRFAPLAQALDAQGEDIISAIKTQAGTGVDLGGYYLFDDAKANAVMRPSCAFNALIDAL